MRRKPRPWPLSLCRTVRVWFNRGFVVARVDFLSMSLGPNRYYLRRDGDHEGPTLQGQAVWPNRQ